MPEREADPRLQGALGLSKPLQRSFGHFSMPRACTRPGESPVEEHRSCRFAADRMRTTPDSVNDK